MKRALVVIGIVGVLALPIQATAQDVNWGQVKAAWNTLSDAERASYMEMYQAKPMTAGPGSAIALGRVLKPSALVPGDTCGAATQEISALPYSDSGDNSALADDYDLVASATCNTTFNSSGTEIAYHVRTDITCDINVAESVGSYDVVLWAVTDCSDPDNTCVGSSDGGNPESFTFSATGGTDYWVLVDGWNGQGGAYTLDLTEATQTGCALVPVDLQSVSVE